MDLKVLGNAVFDPILDGEDDLISQKKNTGPWKFSSMLHEMSPRHYVIPHPGMTCTTCSSISITSHLPTASTTPASSSSTPSLSSLLSFAAIATQLSLSRSPVPRFDIRLRTTTKSCHHGETGYPLPLGGDVVSTALRAHRNRP